MKDLKDLLKENGINSVPAEIADPYIKKMGLDKNFEETFLVDDDETMWVTVKYAADMCLISASTMRRRAKAGEVKYKMVDRPHGDTMFLLFDDVKRVKSAMQMLTVKKASSNQEMAFALSQMMGEFIKEHDSVVMDKLAGLEAQNQALQGRLDQIGQDIAAIAKNAIQGTPERPEGEKTEPPTKKSFLGRWFSKK